MNIQEYLKEQYQENLKRRYQSLKSELESESFVPEAEDVWKMYGKYFDENTGVCNFICFLLNVEMYDESGKLNEFHIALDEYNLRMCDLCQAYVAGRKVKSGGLPEVCT